MYLSDQDIEANAPTIQICTRFEKSGTPSTKKGVLHAPWAAKLKCAAVSPPDGHYWQNLSAAKYSQIRAIYFDRKFYLSSLFKCRSQELLYYSAIYFCLDSLELSTRWQSLSNREILSVRDFS